MADFNNLLGEIDDVERSIRPTQEEDTGVEDNVGNISNQDDPRHQEYDQHEDDGNNEDVEGGQIAQIPPALSEAESLRARRRYGDDSLNDEASRQRDGFHVDDDDDGVVGGFVASNNDDEDIDEEEGQAGPDAEYEKLKHLWVQEVNCTELLPYDSDTISMLMEVLAGQEETMEQLQHQAKSSVGGGGNVDPNLASLAASICKMDADRLSFMLADLTRTRLAKIEKYALHNREVWDRLSEHERTYLKQYGELFERHMQRSVTNHFAKEAWKKLDEPEMIDRPNLDTYVFCRILEPVQINNLKDFDMGQTVDEDDGDDDLDHIQDYQAGSTLFLRYAVIRDFVLEGKVELLM